MIGWLLQLFYLIGGWGRGRGNAQSNSANIALEWEVTQVEATQVERETVAEQTVTEVINNI